MYMLMDIACFIKVINMYFTKKQAKVLLYRKFLAVNVSELTDTEANIMAELASDSEVQECFEGD